MKLRATSCRNVRGLLPLHAGGDLDQRQSGAVDEHLHACLSCFREFRELVTMRGRLGVLAEQPLPKGALDGFTEEVMARVTVGEPGPRAEIMRSVAWRRRIPRLAAAAALLLMVGAGAYQVGLLDGTRLPGDLPGSDRVEMLDTLADTSTKAPSPPAARGPSHWSGQPLQIRRSHPLDSVVFDFLPAGQQVPQSGQTSLDLIGPVFGHGLVPERGRELRPRYPLDQR